MTPEYRFEKWSFPYEPNAAMLRVTLTAEGYTVYQWGDTPGVAYPHHMHPNDQSHWIISGCLEMTIENFGTVLLEAGTRDWMPAGVYHSARVVGESPAIYLVGER